MECQRREAGLRIHVLPESRAVLPHTRSTRGGGAWVCTAFWGKGLCMGSVEIPEIIVSLRKWLRGRIASVLGLPSHNRFREFGLKEPLCPSSFLPLTGARNVSRWRMSDKSCAIFSNKMSFKGTLLTFRCLDREFESRQGTLSSIASYSLNVDAYQGQNTSNKQPIGCLPLPPSPPPELLALGRAHSSRTRRMRTPPETSRRHRSPFPPQP